MVNSFVDNCSCGYINKSCFIGDQSENTFLTEKFLNHLKPKSKHWQDDESRRFSWKLQIYPGIDMFGEEFLSTGLKSGVLKFENDFVGRFINGINSMK